MGPGGRGFYLLRELSRLGYSCIAITSDSNHLDPSPKFQESTFTQQIDDVTVTWIKTVKYEGAKSLRRILSWLDFDIKTLGFSRRILQYPDVIVASSLSLTTIVVGLILKRRYKARLVFEVRDIWPLTITEEGGYSPINPFVLLLSFIERIGYRWADAIVGTMPNLESHVRDKSSSRKPVYCIPMGFDEFEVKLQSEKQLPKPFIDAKIPRNKFIVGYAGTIGTTNALEVLFAAASELSWQEKIHFVVVGDGDKLGEFTKRFSGQSNISFIGQVPKKSVQFVLEQFDVAYFSTLPSRVWDYGLSLNKLIDYMLAAKPIIASFSGYPSMLNESGCGVFVPAGDAVALSDEIERFRQMPKSDLHKMGQRGRSWLLSNRSYKELAEDYQSILFPK